MAGVADEIADNVIAYSVDVNRFWASAQRETLFYLEALQDDLVKRIQALSLRGSEVRQIARLEKLLGGVRQSIRRAYRGSEISLNNSLRELGAWAYEVTPGLINTAIGADLASVSFSRNTIRRLVDRTLVEGGTVREWWAKQARDLEQAFLSEMRMGISQGETNAQLVQRIRGTSTGGRVVTTTPRGRRRVFPEFRGGIMDTTTRNAEALVRSSVQDVANRVLLDTYRQNEDIVRGVQALVTLDLKTTVICISRAGASWNLRTGAPLPGSPRDERFPGPPPWHWQCRTVLTAVTYTWEEIINRTKGAKRRAAQQIAPETRASIGGPVTLPDMTYESWLRRQSVPRQRRALGRERYKLWREGKIKGLSQLTDQRGRPLRVTELREGKGLVQPVPQTAGT